MRNRHLFATSCFVLSLLGSTSLAYDRNQFLNFAFFHLPPEYLAGIPLETRKSIFAELSSDPTDNRISYSGSCLHYEITHAAEGGSTRVWLKLLPRDMGHKVLNPYSPLVFVHTAESLPPAADSEETRYRYQTRIVKWDSKKTEDPWTDITESTLPEGLDRSLHLRPDRELDFIEVRVPENTNSHPNPSHVLAWSNWKLQLRKSYPYYSSYPWDAPFDPKRLAHRVTMHLLGRGDERELAENIVHAGFVGDESFRFLLEMEELKNVPLLTYALASYEYSLDRNEECIDFMVAEVERTGNGDTNAKWMLHYFDEWDRTLEIYEKFDGTDGAAAEASVGFVQDRRFFFPENFEKHWARKQKEIQDRK